MTGKVPGGFHSPAKPPRPGSGHRDDQQLPSGIHPVPRSPGHTGEGRSEGEDSSFFPRDDDPPPGSLIVTPGPHRDTPECLSPGQLGLVTARGAVTTVITQHHVELPTAGARHRQDQIHKLSTDICDDHDSIVGGVHLRREFPREEVDRSFRRTTGGQCWVDGGGWTVSAEQ